MARTKEIDFVAVRRDERIYVQGCRNPILDIIKSENIIKKENKRRRNLMKAEIAEVFMNPVRQRIGNTDSTIWSAGTMIFTGCRCQTLHLMYAGTPTVPTWQNRE